MFPNTPHRPALGQSASLGTLYDARSDTFLPLSLLRRPPPDAAITTTDIHTSDVKYSRNDTYKKKFDDLGINAELSASFLAGLINVEGSGRYLTEKRDSNNVMHASLHYNVTTVHEKLNLSCNEVKDCLAFEELDNNVATHVVAEIGWGAHSIVSVKHQVSNAHDQTDIGGHFEAEFETLKLMNTAGSAELERSNGGRSTGNSFEVTIYGDVLADDGLLPTDFESAYKFISNVPRYIAGANNGKGKPLIYTLLPITVLSFILPIEIKAHHTITQLSVECLEKFVQLFDEFRTMQQTLNDYYGYIRSHQSCIPADHMRVVVDHLNNARAAEATLKSNYARLLKDVRAGKADAQQLWKLYEAFHSRGVIPENVVAVTNGFKDKVEFIDMIVSKGATYIGYGTASLDSELIKNRGEDAYVFYFNEELRSTSSNPSWNDIVVFLLELLQDNRRRGLVLLVDCDATGDRLEKPYISHRRNGNIIAEDLLEEWKLLIDKCVIRYKDEHLDKSMTKKPIQRRPVRMPCPGRECSQTTHCDWICFRCHTSVEYGHTDSYLYCDCGRSLYNYYDFKCKDPTHGLDFERYDQRKLLALLNKLQPYDELNILILGETGVGKSTFINSFVNYLTFQSLDDAMSFDKLNYIIPCSFSTQEVDHADPNGRLIQKDIKIGSSDDEKDGTKGQSATQKTTVYPVSIGNTIVRLIDTPGIGDTRGVEQDQKNMADILSVLRNYEKLHGILILLKPNNSRLTVMFKFCIKELLTHLHRNAADNVAFGFTNTRGSNYQPGDTFKPLEALLSEYQDVCEIGLFKHTVYCFDSESFRYLAAQKQNVDMGNVDDYRRSWVQSTTEAQRLLEHFRVLRPHEVKSTLSLNGTRHLIAQLTKPMADIAQVIKTTIEVNEDNAKELSQKRLSGEDLRRKLDVKKVTLKKSDLNRPRTVCGNRSCVDYKNDGINDNELTTVYRTLCHAPCYLNNVPVDRVGTAEIRGCAAFRGRIDCLCGHGWQEHLHITYELRPESITVQDSSIEAALRDNASVIKLTETAIAAKKKYIEELQGELGQIQEAAVQFSIFLKRYSITPYNDATLEYLEHLIKEEKGKVGAGGSRARLDGLQQYRREYQQLILVLTNNMKTGSTSKYQLLTEDGVEQLVCKLYKLKHYGNDLRHIRAIVDNAHAATYREKPYQLRPRNRWDSSRPSFLRYFSRQTPQPSYTTLVDSRHHRTLNYITASGSTSASSNLSVYQQPTNHGLVMAPGSPRWGDVTSDESQ